MLRTVKLGASCSFVAVLLFVSGCTPGDGKEGVHLSGKVTIGGKPVSAGEGIQASIIFSPTATTQLNPASSTIVDGKYDVKNAPKGKVLVTFLVMKAGPPVSFDGVARPQPSQTSLVPEGKSKGVEIQVDGDKTDLNFDL